MSQQMLVIQSLFPLPFINPAWTSESSWFTYCLKTHWRSLNITLLVCEISAIVHLLCYSLSILWHFLFWDWNENWSFPVLCQCFVFQTCCHSECSSLTASSFRIWTSSTGIPSSPLAFCVMMLPKAHLKSHLGREWFLLQFNVYLEKGKNRNNKLWTVSMWHHRIDCSIFVNT